MKRRRKTFKSAIAILLTIATVLNTGFSTVASEIVTDDGIVVNNDAAENAVSDEDAVEEVNDNSNDISIEVVSDKEEESDETIQQEDDLQVMSDEEEESDEEESELIEESDALSEDDIEEVIEEVIDEESIAEDQGEEELVYEEAEELKDGELTVDNYGITGSGYDEISVYVNTDKLDNKDTFRIVFDGPENASYNPIIGDELDKTSDGYFDFEELDGNEFSIYAESTDDVILSYSFNEDGYPMITAESKEAEKILGTTSLTAEDGENTVAVTGSGFDTINIEFVTDDLSENGQFKLYVDTNAEATVDGADVRNGISELDKATQYITVENLDDEEFQIYAVTDNELKIKSEVEVVDSEKGEVIITIATLNEKRIYEYEDDKVYVRAVLEDPEAIPDDAVFSVSPVIFGVEKYLDAMNENADEENKYTEENTLFYDIAFYTDDSKSEEIEPAEGSVNITVEFKKNQLEEEIGVEESESVEVAHIIEEGSNLEAEIIEADISSDSTEVKFETESFSVFGFANVYGTTAKVKISAPVDGKYYVALGKKYFNEHNQWWTESGTLFADSIKEVNVVDGIGEASLVVTNEVSKEGLTINDVGVLLIEPKYDNINIYDQNSYKVIGKDGIYKYSYFVTYEYDDSSKTQNILITEPSGSPVSSTDITGGLDKATDFVILADKFDQGSHFEGNIAVNHFGYKTNFEKGGAKQTQLEITIKKKVESNDAKDKVGTFYFGVYDIDGKKVGDTVSITTNSEGVGETKVTVDNAISSYKVYELNVNGVKLESGDVNNGFEVSYVYVSDTSDGTIASYDGINFTKYVYTSNVLDNNSIKDNGDGSGNVVLTLSGAQLVTCSDNVYREKRDDSAKITPISSGDFDNLININGLLGNVSNVSSLLGKAKSSDSVAVYYISADELASGSITLPDNEGKYIVLNVVADDNASVISYGLGDSQLKIGNRIMKDSTGYYRADDSNQLSKITYWNFIYSNGDPFKGTIIDKIGNGNMNGFMLAPSARFETTGVTGPTSIFANEVKQGGTEIHKNSQPNDVKRYASAEVTNRKQGTDSPANYEFKVQKLFGDWKNQNTWTEEWSGDNDVYGFVLERYYPDDEENPRVNFLVSDKFPMPNGSNPNFGQEDKNEKIYVYVGNNNSVASFGSVTFEPKLPGEGAYAPGNLVQDVNHPGFKKADGTIVQSDINGKISYRCVMYKITELSKKGSNDTYKNGSYVDASGKVSYPDNTVLDATRTKIIKLWVNTYVRPDGSLSVGIEGIDGIEDKVMDPSNPKSTEKDGSFYCYSNNREPIVFRNNKTEDKGKLEIKKTFSFPSNMSLEDKTAAKDAISFAIDGPEGYTDKTITLSSFTETATNSGIFVYSEDPVALGNYKVTETNTYSNTRYSCDTTYSVGANATTTTGGYEATVSVETNSTGLVSFVNTYSELLGSLKVKKSLFGLHTNKILTENEMKQITFTVSGPNISKSFTYNDIYSGNKGVLGEYVIENLTIGGNYVVTETNALFGKGYSCSTSYRINSSTSTSGSAATITAASGNTTVEFLNTYSYSAVGYLRINALKSLSGDANLANYNGKFQFEFTSENDNNLSSRGLGNTIVTNHSDGHYITFDTIEYTMSDLHYDSTAGKNVGQYTYTLKEIKPEKEEDRQDNIVYDETEYRFVVDLEDLGNGIIKTTANIYNGSSTTPSYTYENSKISENDNSTPNKRFASEQNESDRPVFTNTYVKPNQLILKTHKSVTGKTACEKSFNFILEETSNVSGQAKKVDTAIRRSATDNQEVEFVTINFNKDDIGKTYTFHVYEEKEKDSNENEISKKDGITYSNAEYTVTVVVAETANHNVDLSNITITPVNTKSEENATNNDNVIVCNFINEYSVKPITMPIYGRKNLIGATDEDTLAGYQFTLEAVNDNASNGEKCVLPSAKTVASAEGTGYFNFDEIEFKEAGEYVFKITENHEGASSINGVYVLNDVMYSSSEYYVTVNVTPDTAGDLVISDSNISVSDGSGENAQTIAVAGLRTDSASSNIIFNNQKITDAEVTLLAKKSMSGLSLSDVAEQFEFELVTKNSGTPVAYTRQVDNSDTKKNAADGVITFNTIKYKLSDLASQNPRTFTYYIHEIKDESKTYYEYDEEYHKVDVVVTYDSSTNTITAVPTYVEDTTYSAVISNTYSEEGSIEIEGNKTLIGRRIASSDDFAFVLKYTGTDSDASGATVKHSSDSNATFATASAAMNVNDSIAASFKQDTFQWSKGKGTGTFKFDKIFVNKPGKYYFELTESNGTQNDVNYNVGDKTYLVTITATKKTNDPGKLELTAEYNYGTTSDKKTDSVPAFINEITTEGSKNFIATKTISNGSAPDDIFKFVLSRDPEATDVIGSPVTNNGSTVTFTSETYKPSDLNGIEADANGLVSRTYTYYITEQPVSSLSAYYDFSAMVYAVKVTISNDADGNFTVGEPVYYLCESENGEEKLTQIKQTDVVFDNEYRASGSVSLFLEKVLNGRAINGDEFSFTLTEENAKTADAYSETVKSSTTEAGAVCCVNFSEITYDANDLSDAKSYPQGDGKFARYYVVKENITGMPSGVTPDSNLEWHVVVTLEDKGNGTIDTDWYAYQGAFAPATSLLTSIADAIRGWINVPQSDQHIRFVNTYAANGKVRFTASKKVVFEDTENQYPINAATDYSFVLTEKFGDVEKTYTATNTLNEDGTISVSFGTDGIIEYSDADKGLHEFVLYETKVGTPVYDETSDAENKPVIGYNNNGIFYDMTEYHIYVNVTDENNDGSLTVTTTTGSETSNNLTGELDENGVFNIEDASFTNHYRVTDDSVTLGGSKSFIGAGMKTFSFELVETDASGEIIEGGTSQITDNKGEAATAGTSFNFAPIEYKYSVDGKVNGREAVNGEYKFYYQITETDESGVEGMEGIIFDDHKCDVVVTLKLENGVLSHTVVYGDGEMAQFENYYSDGTSIPLSAKKVVKLGDNNKPIADLNPEFIFELTKKDDTSYEAQYAKAVNTATATFETADTYELSNLNKEGNNYVPTTFTYQIRELSAKDEDDKAEYEKLFTATSGKTASENMDAAYAPYTFSDDTYEIDVLVTPTVDAGTNSVSLTSGIEEIRKKGTVVTDDAGNKAKTLSYVVFDNEYSVDDGFVEINGRKFINNHSKKTGIPIPTADSFKFELLDAEKNSIASTNPTDGVFSFTGDSESTGKVVDALHFTYEDISTEPYVFYVREDIPEAGSRNAYVDYDENLFKVEVYVADAGDGTLDIQKKVYINDDANEATKPDGVAADTWFTNEYFDGTQVDFDASKTISTTGVRIPNDFTFTLTQISGNEIASIKNSDSWKKEKNNYVQTVTNNGADIDFEPIEFAPGEVGEYEFEIRETEISYDKYFDKDEGSNFKKADENAYYVVHVKVEFDSDSNSIVANKTYKKFGTGISPVDFEEIPENTERSYVNFVNDYEDHIYVGFGGYKTLLGFDKEEKIYRGEYNFVLSRINDDGTETVIETLPLDTATHEGIKGLLAKLTGEDKQMYFDFEFVEPGSVQEFTQDDIGKTFTYVVKELAPETPEKHIQYSKAIYTAYITVGFDSATNKLKLESRYTVANQDDTGKYAKGNGQPALVSEVKHTQKRREITFEGFDFTNKLQLDGQWQPDVTKEAENFVLDKDHKFDFTITETDSTFTTPIEGGYSDNKSNLTNDSARASVPFDKDTYEGAGDLGNHYYVIKESHEGIDADEGGNYIKNGIIYDAKEWHVTVNVIVDPDDSSKLKVDTVDYDQVDGDQNHQNQSSATITNRYEGQKELTLAVDKILCGRSANDDTFEFALLEDGKPVKDKDGKDIIATLDGTATDVEVDGKKISGLKYKFGTITYTQDSLSNSPFTYTVSEVKGDSLKGIEYSEAIYTVEVTLKVNDDGSLDYDLKYTPNEAAEKDNKDYKKAFEAVGSADAKMKFVNKYAAYGDWDPEGTKTFSGYTGEGYPEFSFVLQEVDKIGEGNKVLYGDSVHNDEDSIMFSSFTVKDTIKGTGKEFLKYTLEDVGTHYYEMFEEIPKDAKLEKNINAAGEPTLNGITYDETVYNITVEVSDNGDGTLKLSIDGEEEAIAEAAKKFKFLNRYVAAGSIDLEATKKMLGRELTEEADYGKYSFTITDKETGESATVTNNVLDVTGKPNKIYFKSKDDDKVKGIEFLNYAVDLDKDIDDRGTHVYTITEGDSSVPGVEKDSSYYEVEVLVADSESAGVLSADVKSITQYKNGIKYSNQDSVEFTNEYKAKGKVSFDGIKHVVDETGKAVSTNLAGRYSFALYEFDDATRMGQGHFINATESAADGSFILDDPEFNQSILNNSSSKTRYFRIVEVMPTNGKWSEDHTKFESAGVVYDRSVYDVDVDISLDKTSDKLIVTKKNAVKKANADTKESTQINVNDKASFTNVLKEYEIIAGKKVWVDTVTNASSRPDVTVYLYSSATGSEVINTYTIKAPNDTYRFETDKNGNKLPSYDDNGKAITYSVDEKEIDGYLKEVVGYNIYNTAGDIRIQKLDSETLLPVEGATLAILSGTTELERWTTEVSAHVVRTALTSGTSYTLREIEAPDGYEVADDMTFVVPTDGSDITVTMYDTPITGSVRLTKRDTSTRGTLAGAEFALYSDDGVRIYATGSSGSYRYTTTTSNGVFATDTSGYLTITDLPYGTYYFVETKAPDGYVLSDERAAFSVTTNGQLAEVTYLNTKATGSVRLRKINANGTRSLEGAVFELYVATPQTLGQAATSTIFSDAYYRYGTYRTNAAGEIYVGDLPWDDYYFIEVEAPTGYEISTDTNGDQLVYTFRVGSTATTTIDLGGITNNTVTVTPPPETPDRGVAGVRVTPVVTATPTPKAAVLGARVEKGGVVPSVLGVRAKPTAGVLGARVGPVTGDYSNMALWIALVIACLAMIITMLIKSTKADKKKSNNRK